MPAQRLVQIWDGNQHAGVAAAQKSFQLQALPDKRAEQLANQLCFAQTISLQGKIIRLATSQFQYPRLPVIEHPGLQGLR
ncbi:hypothetical protein D3C84_668910 [compost metagenome]